MRSPPSSSPFGGGHCPPAECRLRHFGRMGHRQIRVLGQAGLDHLDRSSLLRVTGGRGIDLCAALWLAGCPRALARRARYQDHLRGAGHRAGYHLRHVSLRGTRTDSAHASARQGRGGSGARAGRNRLANLLARDSPLTSNGVCSTASFFAMRGPWENSARCPSYPGIFAAKPIRCRSTSRFSTTNTTMSAAFAVASLLALLSVVTLAAKSLVEWTSSAEQKEHRP